MTIDFAGVTQTIRWENVAGSKPYFDIDKIGRFMVKRPFKGARVFYVYLNGKSLGLNADNKERAMSKAALYYKGEFQS